MGRIVKFIWIISLLSALAVLLYTYASLAEVVFLTNDITDQGSITRETYFYIGLALLVVFNFGFYALSKNMHLGNAVLKEALVNWQLSFAMILNFFYMAAALFIMLFNSGENFNYNNFGYLIFIALGFVALWIVALPVIIVRNRFPG